MNTIDLKAVAVPQTTSPQIHCVESVTWKTSTHTPTRSLNDRMNADPARVMRLAAQNAQRIAGKPNL